MKVFVAYDDLPMRRESFLDVVSITVVPEEEKWLYEKKYDECDRDEFYEVFRVDIINSKKKAYTLHNVLELEIV